MERRQDIRTPTGRTETDFPAATRRDDEGGCLVVEGE